MTTNAACWFPLHFKGLYCPHTLYIFAHIQYASEDLAYLPFVFMRYSLLYFGLIMVLQLGGLQYAWSLIPLDRSSLLSSSVLACVFSSLCRWCSMALAKYSAKRIGLRQSPCGKPTSVSKVFDVSLLPLTFKVQSSTSI